MRTHRLFVSALFAIAVIGANACDPAGEDRILSIDAVGDVRGAVFVDVNGSGAFESQDSSAKIGVALVRLGSVDTVARTTTGSNGVFAFPDVPVGVYRVTIPDRFLGDSLEVVFADVDQSGANDSTVVEIGAADSASVLLGVAYPFVSVAEARALPAGRKVFVRAVATTMRDEFGDTSVYVADTTAAIRVARVLQPPVQVGDTLHVLGVGGTRTGQPVLVNAATFIVGTGDSPEPLDVDPSDVEGARGGSLDAALVRARGLTVDDSVDVNPDGFILHTVYGAASIDVVVRQDGSFDPDAYPLLTTLDVVGILRPTADGRWRLYPRSASDIDAGP